MNIEERAKLKATAEKARDLLKDCHATGMELAEAEKMCNMAYEQYLGMLLPENVLFLLKEVEASQSLIRCVSYLSVSNPLAAEALYQYRRATE